MVCPLGRHFAVAKPSPKVANRLQLENELAQTHLWGNAWLREYFSWIKGWLTNEF